MAQPLLIGLMVGLFSLAGAILALIGVLVSTKANFKLGKRTGDVQQQGVNVQQSAVGVQQQTVDVARIEKLVEETEGLRVEIRQLWDANRELRHEFELAEVRHTAEREGWAAEKRTLVDGWAAERRVLVAAADKHADEMASLAGTLAHAQRELERTKAELDIALLAQERAEGGLCTARQAIQDLRPCPAPGPKDEMKDEL